VRADLKSLKDVQDKFLRTYKQVVVQCGGPEWQKVHSETLLHHVRKSIIPIMEQEGMDAKAIQALCSWAERQVMTK
jgi:hypothetical protein